MFEKYDFLDSRPYYCLTSNKTKYYSNLQESLKGLGANRVIDSAGILGILMKNYMLANRTLIQGVERTPWMGIPDNKYDWNYAELPQHGVRCYSAEQVAPQLINLLTHEAMEYISGSKTVGILLSGGMDSRVVAAIIHNLQKYKHFTGQVVALTWGLVESRDVIYARKIAEKFKWSFIHLPLNAEVLYRNVFLAGERGAEYSPVHLHAMDDVSSIKGIDCILAGSYGDSIGRGEYSGCHVSKLPGILDKHLNQFSFMLKKVEKAAFSVLKHDIKDARDLFPGRTEQAYREIERQMHYMRRQLRVCMGVIEEKIPLYQMFTSPEVFGYVWSLSFKCRTDQIYKLLLKELCCDLLQIPWARNGRIYGGKDDTQKDQYDSHNNRYGEWLRRDCRSSILKAIDNGCLQRMGVFNERSLKMWMKRWPSDKRMKADRLDEKMAWLASLSFFIQKYHISGIPHADSHSIRDSLSELKAIAHTKLYHQAVRLLKS